MTERRPHLLVLVGIPGAGKTTYARQLLARCPSLRLVSPDLVREELYPGYARDAVAHEQIDNRRVFSQAFGEVRTALVAGQDVIFDATNLTIDARHMLVLLGRRAHAILIARYFPIAVMAALRRNRGRLRQVPTGVIARMAAKLQPPTRAEGFQRVVWQRCGE